ncbi:hypothetical protein [Pseudomonas sp. 24 R 17]|nr:hypothetical protein [Pseudomonas sp. 24 R 17]
MHRFNAPCTSIAHAFQASSKHRSKNIENPENNEAPYSGALRFLEVFFGTPWPLWHAPCNNPCTTQFRGPWYRQAETPLFTPGVLDANRIALHTALGNLGTGRPGIPSLTPKPLASPRFGSPGTGRPGTPSFIALGDGSPAASGHQLLPPSNPRATAEPPPGSAASRRRSCARASSRPFH